MNGLYLWYINFEMIDIILWISTNKFTANVICDGSYIMISTYPHLKIAQAVAVKWIQYFKKQTHMVCITSHSFGYQHAYSFEVCTFNKHKDIKIWIYNMFSWFIMVQTMLFFRVLLSYFWINILQYVLLKCI